jgi:hypothetical protein
MKRLSIPSTNPDDAYQFIDNRTTFSLRKMIRKRVNKEGLTKVIIEVRQHTYDGTKQYYDLFKRVSTNIWIHPSNWNKKDERVIGDDSYKNKEINKVYAAVQLFMDSKGQQGPDQAYVEAFSLAGLSEFFPDRRENRKCLSDYINEYITFRKNQNTHYNTLKEFTTMMNRVKNYDVHKGKKTYFEDISITWCKQQLTMY